jgi:hypothetical protein
MQCPSLRRRDSRIMTAAVPSPSPASPGHSSSASVNSSAQE